MVGALAEQVHARMDPMHLLMTEDTTLAMVLEATAKRVIRDRVEAERRAARG